MYMHADDAEDILQKCYVNKKLKIKYNILPPLSGYIYEATSPKDFLSRPNLVKTEETLTLAGLSN